MDDNIFKDGRENKYTMGENHNRGGIGGGGKAILMRRRPITQLVHPKNNPGMRTSKVQIVLVSKMILRSNHIICQKNTSNGSTIHIYIYFY